MAPGYDSTGFAPGLANTVRGIPNLHITDADVLTGYPRSEKPASRSVFPPRLVRSDDLDSPPIARERVVASHTLDLVVGVPRVGC
jgi:hypothetical protein